MGDAPATSAKDDEGTTVGFFFADILEMLTEDGFNYFVKSVNSSK
jgi:alpha-acetolactate decarboxylase